MTGISGQKGPACDPHIVAKDDATANGNGRLPANADIVADLQAGGRMRGWLAGNRCMAGKPDIAAHGNFDRAQNQGHAAIKIQPFGGLFEARLKERRRPDRANNEAESVFQLTVERIKRSVNGRNAGH